jgi:lactoylglutathione lyase
MVKYTYTILYVSNVSKSIEFYENAFGFQKKFITPENDYGELTTGETTISFASVQLANSNLKKGFLESDLSSKPFGIELGFTTEDVFLLIEKSANAGAIIVEAPKKNRGGKQ